MGLVATIGAVDVGPSESIPFELPVPTGTRLMSVLFSVRYLVTGTCTVRVAATQSVRETGT
jgi:hypothetical protein